MTPREPGAALRRAVTLPALASAWVLAVATAPAWFVATAALDLVTRGRTTRLRAALFFSWFLSCEVLGVLAGASFWLVALATDSSRGRYLAWNFRFQVAWARALLGGAARLFRLRFEVTGQDAISPGPVLMVVRHVSVADTLLPAVFASGASGLRLRYVLKRELLWDPCLDIMGNRLPNAFVDRAGADSTQEIAKVHALASELGRQEGVLIFPEGTRFTTEKRARVLRRLRDRDDGDPRSRRILAAAETLEHVLPPQVGGVTAALASATRADVVFCAHTGFEGISTLRDLTNGALLDRTIRVHFRRVARASIPREDEACVDWLLAEWRRVDAWIGDARDGADEGDGPATA